MNAQQIRQKWEVGPTSNERATGLDFANASVGLMVVAHNSFGTIYRTSDGGENWTPVRHTSVPLNAVAICGNGTATVVGSDGAILRTTTDAQ